MTNTEKVSPRQGGVMATQRVDEHRVGVLVPEHYVFLDVLDLYAGGGKDDVAALVTRASVPRAWVSFADRQKAKAAQYARRVVGDRPSLSQCSICGAHIRYAVVWSWRPDGAGEVGIITTGVDCAASMGAAKLSEVAARAGALREFVAGMRKKARAAEEAVPAEAAERWTKIDQTRREWLAASPQNRRVSGFLYRTVQEHVTAGCVGPEKCFYCSLAEDLVTRGTLTERQVSAVMRVVSGPIPAPYLPIPSGVTVVMGKIMSLKAGKMLVQGNGFRVWTLPPVELRSAATGSEVRFVADLESSAKDERFLIGRDARDGEVVG
jgi:hypothetical protein